jgi:hypothetical protein
MLATFHLRTVNIIVSYLKTQILKHEKVCKYVGMLNIDLCGRRVVSCLKETSV